jgi:thiamine pyrophosphate-dependent acetolactate synthase large subunit-like protein
MLLGELITLRQQKLPVKIVVFTNGALAFVELEMKAAGFVNYATELENPDFAAVAQALGMYGQRVERPDDLEAALRAAFAHDGPALVEVMVARQELSFPRRSRTNRSRASRSTPPERSCPAAGTNCSTSPAPISAVVGSGASSEPRKQG